MSQVVSEGAWTFAAADAANVHQDLRRGVQWKFAAPGAATIHPPTVAPIDNGGLPRNAREWASRLDADGQEYRGR